MMKRLLVLMLLIIPVALSAAEPGRTMLSACPGQGYLAYRYPTVGSCPCTDESCFHPVRYYACCGDADPAYKKLFWKRWTKAHFCGGSLLEGLACQCISPPASPISISTSAVPDVPPAPELPTGETGTARDAATGGPQKSF